MQKTRRSQEEPGSLICLLPAHLMLALSHSYSLYVFWLKLSAISPRATVQESLRFHANDKVGFAWKPGQNIQNSAIFNEASENVRGARKCQGRPGEASHELKNRYNSSQPIPSVTQTDACHINRAQHVAKATLTPVHKTTDHLVSAKSTRR